MMPTNGTQHTNGTNGNNTRGRFSTMQRTRASEMPIEMDDGTEVEEDLPEVPEEEIVNKLLTSATGRKGTMRQESSVEEEHLTKTGTPDRRFKGQRDLPDQTVRSDSYRPARTGGIQGGVHTTLEGKPDRRFQENRGLDEEGVMKKFAENLADQYGIRR